MLPGTAHPSQTKPRNSLRLHILRHTAERKGLYFLPGNFGECNPLAFKINSCSHSPAMLADGPVPHSVHTHRPLPLLWLPRGKRDPSSKANCCCPRSWFLLPADTLTLLCHCLGFGRRGVMLSWVGEHQGVDETQKPSGERGKMMPSSFNR